MSLRYCELISGGVLLILAIVGILLLALSTKEIEVPPENMVIQKLFLLFWKFAQGFW